MLYVWNLTDIVCPYDKELTKLKFILHLIYDTISFDKLILLILQIYTVVDALIDTNEPFQSK